MTETFDGGQDTAYVIDRLRREIVRLNSALVGEAASLAPHILQLEEDLNRMQQAHSEGIAALQASADRIADQRDAAVADLLMIAKLARGDVGHVTTPEGVAALGAARGERDAARDHLRLRLREVLRHVTRCGRCCRPATYQRALTDLCDLCASDPELDWADPPGKEECILPQANAVRMALGELGVAGG